MIFSSFWRIWCKAIGDKSGKNDSDSDKIALVRTLFLVFPVMITNFFIVINILKSNGWFPF